MRALPQRRTRTVSAYHSSASMPKAREPPGRPPAAPRLGRRRLVGCALYEIRLLFSAACEPVDATANQKYGKTRTDDGTWGAPSRRAYARRRRYGNLAERWKAQCEQQYWDEQGGFHQQPLFI